MEDRNTWTSEEPYENPELRELRTSVLTNVNKDLHLQILNEIIPQVKDIHVAQLFDQKGLKALQTICQCLSATPKSDNYAGWQDVADKLGFDQNIINGIRFNQWNGQSHAFNTILAYKEKTDATIDKLLKAFYDLQRWDILIDIKSEIVRLTDNINKHTRPQKGILKSINVPIELMNLDVINQEDINTNNIKQKYDKRIFLTFASDSKTLAKDIAIKLRKSHNGKRIGVYILDEHATKVNEDYDATIRHFLKKSSYVFPILSPDYISLIYSHKSKSPLITSSLCLDEKYVKHIYSEILTDYTSKNCTNKKVRCIIPDDTYEQISKHLSNSLFRVWYFASQIEELVPRILHNTT